MRRVKVGAIIVVEDKVAVLQRQVDDKVYYTFPAGFKELYESEEECVIRKAHEEFGIYVAPIRKLYEHTSALGAENFYLSTWLTGEFGKVAVDDPSDKYRYGYYKPVLIDIKDMPSLLVMPFEIADRFYRDYMKNTSNFKDTSIAISGTLAK